HQVVLEVKCLNQNSRRLAKTFTSLFLAIEHTKVHQNIAKSFLGQLVDLSRHGFSSAHFCSDYDLALPFRFDWQQPCAGNVGVEEGEVCVPGQHRFQHLLTLNLVWHDMHVRTRHEHQASSSCVNVDDRIRHWEKHTGQEIGNHLGHRAFWVAGKR